MNKGWLIGLATLAIAVLLFFYLRPSAEQRAWHKCKQENTIASFENYTENFPAGDSIFEAYIYLDQLWWTKTEQENTTAAYQEYLQLTIPNKAFLEQAQAGLIKLQPLDTLSNVQAVE